MNEDHVTIEFSAVLAACVHDMKNSLFLLLQSLEQLTENKELPVAYKQELAKLHYEAYRVNTNLMQLLGLYRLEKKRLPLQIEENFVSELLEELIAKNTIYLENREIEVTLVVDPDLCWYFDADLIGNLLSDIMNNTLRYCQGKIQIEATVIADELQILIQDDGPGYPSPMLDFNMDNMGDYAINNGRTGLGLYFAALIAQSHRNQGKTGAIQLKNGGLFGGSVFTLTLP